MVYSSWDLLEICCLELARNLFCRMLEKAVLETCQKHSFTGSPREVPGILLASRCCSSQCTVGAEC